MLELVLVKNYTIEYMEDPNQIDHKIAVAVITPISVEEKNKLGEGTINVVLPKISELGDYTDYPNKYDL